MIPNPSLHWNEILSAYADGEFEGRDDLALLKQRVEDWLARHPEAQAELAQIRQLKQLWRETTPASPAPKVWQEMLEAIEQVPRRPARSRRALGVVLAVAACVAVGLTIWLTQRSADPVAMQPGPAAEEEVFSVAAAHEVEILNVEGADAHTLVVGELPVKGPLELADAGDVTITSMQPAARDNMVPEARTYGPGRPMIWARIDTD